MNGHLADVACPRKTNQRFISVGRSENEEELWLNRLDAYSDSVSLNLCTATVYRIVFSNNLKMESVFFTHSAKLETTKKLFFFLFDSFN